MLMFSPVSIIWFNSNGPVVNSTFASKNLLAFFVLTSVIISPPFGFSAYRLKQFQISNSWASVQDGSSSCIALYYLLRHMCGKDWKKILFARTEVWGVGLRQRGVDKQFRRLYFTVV